MSNRSLRRATVNPAMANSRSARSDQRRTYRSDSAASALRVSDSEKRHFSRYTPEMVEETCGIPQKLFSSASPRRCARTPDERKPALSVYAVGWTQHSIGVQYIRTAAIIQLLLGNMGRPGGGILALRGHASIQGSTDIPTLYNLLPGYLPMPKAESIGISRTTFKQNQSPSGWWGEFPKYFVSLMKAWFGDAATKENNWCYDYLPMLTGDHSHMNTVVDMADGKLKGYFVMGENPVVGSMNGSLQRKGCASLIGWWCAIFR